ncbi:glutaredoxin [Patescibacteria group bacterium]|jgi:thiol-disulfide isomerase/thioredoxin|nr:glutaredoxin [Patescibacteria group bacterium]
MRLLASLVVGLAALALPAGVIAEPASPTSSPATTTPGGVVAPATTSPAALTATSSSGDVTVVPIHFFQRDDCSFCKAEKAFFSELENERDDFEVISYDVIDDPDAKALFGRLTGELGIARVTPITVIGTQAFQGFNGPDTTGRVFTTAIDTTKTAGIPRETLASVPALLDADLLSPELSAAAGACDEEGTACYGTSMEDAGIFFTLPLIGNVDLQSFSLTTLSIVLGVVDGFNPCAMWVLLTFILILMQIGDRRKLIQVAGLFILAQGIMYNLILNLWYTTWDFVALDAIVTPLVGLLAIGGGLFFLWRYRRERYLATCDVADLETQSKITQRIQNIAKGPMSLAAAIGIIGIALSINVIEFACSIGIPQAYTKILELNELSFLARQGQLAIFTLFYMIDDLIVFSLAIWGIDKLHHHGAKYSQYSLLIGGILMLILGLLLTFAPDVLVL